MQRRTKLWPCLGLGLRRVCVALLGLTAAATACAAQPPASPAPATPAAAVPAQSLRHLDLKIDGQRLQLEAQSLDIDAQTIEAGAKGQTFRGNVRLTLQLARSPLPGHAQTEAGAAGSLTLILQANAVDLSQPPLHISVRPGGGCSVTLQDQSGRQIWSLAGKTCDLHALDEARRP